MGLHAPRDECSVASRASALTHGSQGELNIGYIDHDVLVAWKPHGVLTSGNSGATFKRRITQYMEEKNSSERPLKIEPCHRLDFATSGWVVFGLHLEAIQKMGDAFAQQTVIKRYLALLHGAVPQSMRIRLPIDGQTAHTDLECIQTGEIAGAGAVSLVALQLHTGRTHQIRKHTHALRHGVVGDDQYKHANGVYRGKGLFLCAHEIKFSHPISGHPIHIAQLPSRKFMKIPFVHQARLESRILLSSLPS